MRPVAKGFFSVWMQIFKDESEILLKLITSFVGTDSNCFDENFKPIPRVGGII